MSVAFLSCPSPYVLRQGLSLNLELTSQLKMAAVELQAPFGRVRDRTVGLVFLHDPSLQPHPIHGL